MWTDAGVEKAQSFKIVQHLRSSLGGNVIVPYSGIDDLNIGVTIPQTGSIELKDPDSGRIETKQSEYNSIVDEFKFELTKLLTSHEVRAADFDDNYFVIGGDHGKGAF